MSGTRSGLKALFQDRGFLDDSHRLPRAWRFAGLAAVTAFVLLHPTPSPCAQNQPTAPATQVPAVSRTTPAQSSDQSDTGGFEPKVVSPGGVELPRLANDMNEQVIWIPAPATAAAEAADLETTIFRPDGPGPFPMVVFNHGKERGDPHDQARSRPLAFAREFVRRGYIVVAPNRRGFSRSGGQYVDDGCNLTENGLEQADDVTATIDYMSHQPYVDASRIIVAGASHGGLISLAYGVHPAAGVRGILNFSGGLRQDTCPGWQDNMVNAFNKYGAEANLPTLWFYGDNDALWPASLVHALFTAYTDVGGRARLIDFGAYKDNAHRMVGDRDATSIWWPPVATFLTQLGMPTAIRYRMHDLEMPPPSGFAPVQAVDAVPFLGEAGRAGYQGFLAQYPHRAFAISASGAWAWAEGGYDPLSVALDSCQRNSHDPCHLYAVDNAVVWRGENDTTPTAIADNR